jgi:hypothetical protein
MLESYLEKVCTVKVIADSDLMQVSGSFDV